MTEQHRGTAAAGRWSAAPDRPAPARTGTPADGTPAVGPGQPPRPRPPQRPPPPPRRPGGGGGGPARRGGGGGRAPPPAATIGRYAATLIPVIARNTPGCGVTHAARPIMRHSARSPPALARSIR